MSLRNSEIAKRWKERHRSHSGTTTLADPPASASRPTTAVDSWTDYNNNALPKVIETAVLAAFGSDVFRDAVASMVEPALSKQQEKLNQLKLANLNLESTLQTRLDELPLLLQPVIDHMTAIKIPSHEKELEKLAAGQTGCLQLLETFDERMESLENQVQGFDGRMKALEDKVVNADLRSAIRFGEISNELQDRNTSLSDRLWELEREVGGKIDGQQRRVVGLGEDLSKAIRKTQDKISALEMMHSTKNDENSASNNELIEKIEMMNKSLSKIDALESSLRRDINAVGVKVSSLDLSPLASYPRKLEAIERTISSLKTELETQGTLASLDSKLLSANNARLDAVASNLANIGYLLGSVKEEISDNEAVQSHTEKLESLDLKMTELIDVVGAVQKHISSLNTSALTSHSTQLGDLTSSITRIEGGLKLLDTTPLISHSATLDQLKSTIKEMQANIDGRLSSQDKSLSSIDEKVSSLPGTAGFDSILSSLDRNRTASSKEAESLSKAVDKLLDGTVSTLDALSSQSTTLETTSQALAALQTEISNTMKPLSSGLKDIGSRIGLGNDTLSNLDRSIQDLIPTITSQESDLAEMKRNTGISDIISTLKTTASTQAAVSKTVNESLEEIQKSIQEMHGSTMSEIRHKNASILSEVQKSNTSHIEHAARLLEAKNSNDAHAKALEDGFGRLGATGEESQACLNSLSTALDTAKQTHSTALEEVLKLAQSHSNSLTELNANSAKILSGQEKTISVAETHSSAIATLQDSAPKKEDFATLQAHFGSVLDILDKHKTALEGVSTAESISSLSEQISGSRRDVLASNADTMQGEFKSLKALLEANGPLGVHLVTENTKVYENVSEVLEEIRLNKALTEKNSSATRAEATAIMEEAQKLRGLAQDANDNSKVAEACLQSQLKSIADKGKKAFSSMSTISSLLESLKEQSTTAPILESVANLRSLVENQHTASLSPEILQITKDIEDRLNSQQQSMEDMQHSMQAFKDDATTSSILSEIVTLKETTTENASSLLAVHDTLDTVGSKIKDSEKTISKSIQAVQTAISEDAVSRKSASDGLAADVKHLETNLETSTTTLRADVKATHDIVQVNGQAIEKSHAQLLDINTVVARTGVNLNGLLTEHLPKLDRDIQAIDLSKLDNAAAETGSALTSISNTLNELSRNSKGHDTLISELDKNFVKASNLTSNEITKVQTALQVLDDTLSQSNQEATKTHKLLQSHTTVLDSVKSDLLSNNTSTTSTLSTLSTGFSSISSELSTITPAVRINSAAISRVDRAVLETGAQIKSVVLEGNSKLSRELEHTLEQLDESLHDSGTRIMGISDFDLPRLEETVKGLEGMVERAMGGNLKAARRNRDALSVIGARVVGTQKKFDEMVEAHGEWEDGGRSMEGSGVLSAGGRPEHRRFRSGRFRALSNASSGKDGGVSGLRAASHT
jgi:chromosome segregation ATPase